MPAEWEPHEGTWLAWPKDPVTWPDRVPQVEQLYLQMIEALTWGEKVFLLSDSPDRPELAEGQRERVTVYPISTVDAWIRDYGPNFIVREVNGKREVAYNHWIFNAWGGKYSELMEDTCVPQRLKSHLKLPVFEPKIVLEGGSIEVNGQGVCLTTRQCLLNKNRNPRLSQETIENYLMNFLGVERVVWLNEGLEGDDTDGHIDDMARFVGPKTVICALEENRADKNHKILKENFGLLEKAGFEVIPLPMPPAIDGRGTRLPASYANFYIGNAVVLVPTFAHKNDDKVLSLLQSFFPSRKMVGLDCRDLIWGMGAIHCVTQQMPQL